jgi:hypothetical protein
LQKRVERKDLEESLQKQVVRKDLGESLQKRDDPLNIKIHKH